MKKKTLILIVSIVLLLAAAVVCLAPRISRVNLDMDAVKLDADGNEAGTARIRIEGVRLDYLFRKDRLEVTVYPFDGLSNIRLIESSGVEGAILPCEGKDYCKVSLTGWTESDEQFFGELAFSPEFDRLVIRRYSEEACYYVASADGSLSTETLARYFDGIIPQS